MSSSRSSSIANISNVLGAVSERASEAPQSDDPTMVILKQLLSGMIPVSDLPDLTKLSAAECLAAVERLRSRQQVEIVEVPDQANRKFIRLTKAGYAVFAA
jgi:hypothetical protein